jgi:hypothetical protein
MTAFVLRKIIHVVREAFVSIRHDLFGFLGEFRGPEIPSAWKERAIWRFCRISSR